ncbi:Protein of unknown function [Lactobacillus equicursoris 66c]|uniref:Uncharacterized protein n=1 Tax=Lactobacillus equicursoris 66c TaxID=872326 RepID=K0NVP0_9LACO|nr:Protein of unknown function [Lactobacillus equicursoris 66c]
MTVFSYDVDEQDCEGSEQDNGNDGVAFFKLGRNGGASVDFVANGQTEGHKEGGPIFGLVAGEQQGGDRNQEDFYSAHGDVR